MCDCEGGRARPSPVPVKRSVPSLLCGSIPRASRQAPSTDTASMQRHYGRASGGGFSTRDAKALPGQHLFLTLAPLTFH